MIERAFYSVKEFCERNNISRPTFYRIKWGDLRPVKFGRRTLVPVDCVLPTSIRPPKLPKPPEYNSWSGMKQRCTNPKAPDYPAYGARGVSVCERWNKFENFLADMGPRPSPKHSIDRYPNNDGNYEPGNCRWATPQEQQANRRTPANAPANVFSPI